MEAIWRLSGGFRMHAAAAIAVDPTASYHRAVKQQQQQQQQHQQQQHCTTLIK